MSDNTPLFLRHQAFGKFSFFVSDDPSVTLFLRQCGKRKKACVKEMHRLECGVQNARMGGRVVECSGLENRRRVTFRGFESHPIR